MNKAYFKQSFKSEIKLLLFILLVGLISYPLIAIFTYYKIQRLPIVGYCTTYLAILCYVIPLLKLNYLYKKNKLDSYYSLPIKRESICFINLLIGYLQIFISFTITYFLGMFITMFLVPTFNYGYYLPLYLSLVILSLLIYLFNSFICSIGNTIFDAVIILFLYTLLPFVLYLLLNNIITINYFTLAPVPFSAFANFNEFFTRLIAGYNSLPYQLKAVDYIFPILYGLIGIIGLIIKTKKDKAERAEQITDSYLGYKVLTPVYYTAIFLSVILEDGPSILLIVLIIIYLIGEIIHYRRIKIPKTSYIVLGACTAFCLLFMIVYNIIS